MNERDRHGLIERSACPAAVLVLLISCGGATQKPGKCEQAAPVVDGTDGGGVTCEEIDGIEMCLVPEGEFMMGMKPYYQNGDPVEAYRCMDDGPYRSVWVDAFWMDRTEVTVRQYLECVQAGMCGLYDSIMFEGIIKVMPDEEELPEIKKRINCAFLYPVLIQHPMNCVNIYQAHEYCLWRGKRLPTEAEWEKAARGTEGNLLPWGMGTPTCEDSVLGWVGDEECDNGYTQEVCTHPKDVSPYGVCDMLGNVQEWAVYHSYEEGEYPHETECGFLGSVSAFFHPLAFLRGGGYKNTWSEFLLAGRGRLEEEPQGFDWSEDLGFRCASD